MSEIKTEKEVLSDVLQLDGFQKLENMILDASQALKAMREHTSQYKAKVGELELDVEALKVLNDLLASERDTFKNNHTIFYEQLKEELTSLKQEKERLCSGYIDCIQMLSDACGYLSNGNDPEGIKLINAANKKLLALHP